MAFQFVNITKIIESVMGKNSIAHHVMLHYYKEIVKKEVELSKAKSTDRILCVGGGYFPCTAILFHQLSKATVTVIDNDLEAVEVATKLVDKMGLANKVFVKHTDGVDISAQEFDIVHIAMQVAPKEEVFQRLHGTINKRAKILVRTPKQHLERGYQPFQQISTTKHYVKQPSFSNIERTLLYVR